MSTSETPERIPVSYDFREELRMALECAPFLEFSEDGQSLKTLATYEKLGWVTDKPPDALVAVDDDIEPSDVITDSPDAYLALIRQARELIYTFLDSETNDKHAQESLEHEMAHAAAAVKLGQVVKYGIRIAKIKVSDTQTATSMTTLITYEGEDLSKADLAFIAAAPEMPSEADQHLVRTLGYTSCKQARESHPLFSNPSTA